MDLKGELTRYRRGYVGFMFQLCNLILSWTAEENVALVTETALIMARNSSVILVVRTKQQIPFVSCLAHH